MTQSNDAAGGREWNPYELATPIARGPADARPLPPGSEVVGLNGLSVRRLQVDDDVPALAGIGARVVASLIDTALWAIPLLLVWRAAAGAYRLMSMGLEPQFDMMASKMGIALLLWAVLAAWNIAWLVMHGQTIGKRLMSIRILRTDGSRVGALRILLLRGCVVSLIYGLITAFSDPLALVFWIVALLLIFGQARQCLHDRIADTQVFDA